MFEARIKKEPKLIMTRVSATTSQTNKPTTRLRPAPSAPDTDKDSLNLSAPKDTSTSSPPTAARTFLETSDVSKRENFPPQSVVNTADSKITSVSVENAQHNKSNGESVSTKSTNQRSDEQELGKSKPNSFFRGIISQSQVKPSKSATFQEKLQQFSPREQETKNETGDQSRNLSQLSAVQEVSSTKSNSTNSSEPVFSENKVVKNPLTDLSPETQSWDIDNFERPSSTETDSLSLQLSDICLEENQHNDKTSEPQAVDLEIDKGRQDLNNNNTFTTRTNGAKNNSQQNISRTSPKPAVHRTVIKVTSDSSIQNKIQTKKGPAPSPSEQKDTAASNIEVATSVQSFQIEVMAKSFGGACFGISPSTKDKEKPVSNRNSSQTSAPQPQQELQKQGSRQALISEQKQIQQTSSVKSSLDTSVQLTNSVDRTDSASSLSSPKSGLTIANIQKQDFKDNGTKDSQMSSVHVKQRVAPNTPVLVDTKQSEAETFETYKMQRGRRAEVIKSETKESKPASTSSRSSLKGKAAPAPTPAVTMNGSVRKQSPQRPSSTKRPAPESKAGKDVTSVPPQQGAKSVSIQPVYHQTPGVAFRPPQQQQPQQQQQQLQQYIFRDHLRQIQDSRQTARPGRSLSQPRVVRTAVPLQRAWDDWSIPRVATSTNALNGKTRPTSQQLSFRSSQVVLSVYGDPNYAYTVIEQAPPMSITPMARPTPNNSNHRQAPPMSARSRTDISGPGQPKSILKNNSDGMLIRHYHNPNNNMTNGYTIAQGAPDVYFSTRPIAAESSTEAQARIGEDMISAPFRTISASKKSPPLKKKQSVSTSAPVPLPPRRSSSAGSGLYRYDMGASGEDEPKRKTVTFNRHVQLHHGNQVSTIAPLPVDA